MAPSNVPFRFFVVCFVCYFRITDAQTFTNYYFKNITESSPQNVVSYGLVLDSQNAMYVVGATDGNVFGTWNDVSSYPRTTDMIVAKYVSILDTTTLNRVWGNQIQTNTEDAAYGVSLSTDENFLYVAGTYGKNPAIIELYTSNGTTSKTYSYPVTNVSNFYPRFSDVVPCGTSVCACGYYFTNSSARWDGLIVGLSTSSFAVGWSKMISNAASDDLMNSIAFGSNRLFVAGQVVDSYAKEFYLVELDPSNGATIFQRIWPGTSCSGYELGTGDIDNYINDIVLGSDALYYVGSSTQEIDSTGATTDVCGYGIAMVIGSLPLTDLSVHNWAVNVSVTETGLSVFGNSMSLGSDGILYVAGDSDADVLLGQTGSYPYYSDWFYYTLSATDGTFIDFHLEGTPNDDFCYGSDVKVQDGAGVMGITVYTTANKETVTNYYITNTPDDGEDPILQYAQ